MNREDAEAAMQCDETDPFNAGRRIMLRWGKNVKKIIKRGTGGVAIAPIRKRPAVPSSDAQNFAESKRLRTDSAVSADAQPTSPSTVLGTNGPAFDPEKHGKYALSVQVPEPPARAYFISTIASFVAKDGTILEKRLMELEATNPAFQFLTMPPETAKDTGLDLEQKKKQVAEHIFYRWRVYSFSQGDGFNTWRTEPFQIFKPNGKFWIPPPLNREAALQEEQERKRREEAIEEQKKQRRRRNITGRQFERAARGPGNAADGSAKLTPEELDEFNQLIRRKLCASRDAICEAMAFCFEKSGMCTEIAQLLKEALLEDENSCPGISLETRIARLYLLSDVLFNSQQPGVRNAFRYRDSIEKMAPEVFTSLGKHGGETMGRMRRNKLSSAVSSVLGAWTNWSVYAPAFLDELHARFEGREIKKETEEDHKADIADEKAGEEEEEDVNKSAVQVITEEQRRGFTDVNHEEEEQAHTNGDENLSKDAGEQEQKASSEEDDKGDDIDGEALAEDDLDGEALEEEDDIDGEAFDDDDLDGEALD